MSCVDLKDLHRFFLCSRTDLDLAVCIGNGGQSFSWTVIEPGSLWANILTNELVILGTDEESVYYYSTQKNDQLEEILREYFRLDIDLPTLFLSWCQKDRKLAGKCPRLGIRIINQDSFETFISFLCSQNNGISRIVKMVHELKIRYGMRQHTIRHNNENFDIYTFPSAYTLVNQESELRRLGFGYRAEYITQSCAIISTKPSNYFDYLKNLSYEAVFEELLQFPGVGPKVADCISLFGMNKLESVPIDTHILKVANQYGFKPTTKSLTLKSYKFIGDAFRKLYGPFAGWAHSFLFTNQLKSFK